MTNLAAALKTEIARIARKELRAETDGLKKTIARQRTEITALKRSVQMLEKELKRTSRAGARAERASNEARDVDESAQFRFHAKGLASNRQRLGLSAEDYGLLAGASGQSIYNWERGKTVPRPGNLAALTALRSMGKREVTARLAELKAAA